VVLLRLSLTQPLCGSADLLPSSSSLPHPLPLQICSLIDLLFEPRRERERERERGSCAEEEAQKTLRLTGGKPETPKRRQLAVRKLGFVSEKKTTTHSREKRMKKASSSSKKREENVFNKIF